MSFGSKSLPPPTDEQKRRWALIRDKGCLLCGRYYGHIEPAEIHHVLSGGLRMGHSWTIGLCKWHHRGVYPEHLDPERMESICGPSLARTPRVFKHEFGDGEYLVAVQDAEIEWRGPRVRERKRKRGSQCVASSKTVPRRGLA